jgi:hypothetical protein
MLVRLRVVDQAQKNVLAIGILARYCLVHLVEEIALYFPAEASSSLTHLRQSPAMPIASNVSQMSVFQMAAIDTEKYLLC